MDSKAGTLRDLQISTAEETWAMILSQTEDGPKDSIFGDLTNTELKTLEDVSSRVVDLAEFFGAVGDKRWQDILQRYIKAIRKTIAKIVNVRLTTKLNDTTLSKISATLEQKLDWIFYEDHPSSVTGRICLPLATPHILESSLVPLEHITNAIKEVEFDSQYIIYNKF